ncbi:MAG: phasin family protein [Rickettsiaceae bacterium]|nr:phasin family protein [Rickettsiaceae bacterium]
MSKTSGNNFTETVKMFMNPDYFTNAIKQVPAPDFTHVTESAKRHTKAFSSTTQVATESVQSLMRRYAEIAQSQINDSLRLLQNMTSSTNPEEAVAHQQEYLRDSVDVAIANTKEIIDMASKSAMEMFNIVSAKVAEDVNHSLKSCCHGNKNCDSGSTTSSKK